MARIPWEFVDPRPTNDPAWGGTSSTQSDEAELGFGDDPGYDPDVTRFGEDAFDRLEGFNERPDELHPCARRRGHLWQSRAASVEDVMTVDPRVVGPDTPVEDVARIMRDEDVGVVPVVDEGHLVGLVTDRDLVLRVVAHGLDQHRARARDVMTSDDLAVAYEDDPLSVVLDQMERHRVRRIPIVAEDDTLLGIVAMADLARQADVDFELQDALLEISSDRSFWSRLR